MDGTLLYSLGREVRLLRRRRNMTLKALAQRSELSVRFLGKLEKGEGNISIGRLAAVARALDCALSVLIHRAEQAASDACDRKARIIALLGVRGAGKSTLGPLIAESLGVEFVELDHRIEELAGMSLAQLFELGGEPHYRELERHALQSLLSTEEPIVLATGGSLVSHPESWELLKRRAHTVWLRARAQDHWDRVLAQGDDRPMRRRDNAFDQLQTLLSARQPLYQQADSVVDTSAGAIPELVNAVLSELAWG